MAVVRRLAVAAVFALPLLAALAGPLPADNPFASESPLPLHYPPFDRIGDDSYRPAIEAGMAEERAEVAVITANPEPATFDNSILALERSGRLIGRALTTFSSLNTANTDEAMLQLQAELAPQLSEHEDAIHLDPALFARVAAVYAARETLDLDPESRQLLDRTWRDFVRAGAQLPPAGQARLRELNAQLASATTLFRKNLLAASRDGAIVVDDPARLAGLGERQLGACAAAAKARGLDGKWLISLQNTTVQPLLESLSDRALREQLYRASVARSVGGANDNTAVIATIVKLRAERAGLLGYPNHAAYVLDDETAGTTAAVDQLIRELAPPAIANARREAAELQAAIDAEARAAHAKPFKLAAWDWAYYAAKVEAQKLAVDDAQIRPYFEVGHVLEDGVFYAAHELYGLSFRERHDLPVYQPELRVFDVLDRDGAQLGIFIADYYARDNKQGGAWMNAYVTQSGLFGNQPVVANHLNLAKPATGQPTLLSFDEVTTMFHEFGHALHGLLSDVRYASLAGTAVPRDFVEYPSQYNEMWARDPGVLAHYARHYETGAPLPQALLDKVLAATRFGAGFKTVEYLAAAALDQRWHRLTVQAAPTAAGVMAFERRALAADGLDAIPAIGPRYHSTYFQHIFAGGYSAAYYAYLWSEVLARDTEAWMKAHGGLKRENGAFLRAKVLSRGRSRDVGALFREFYGTGPEIGPLLLHRGLQPVAKARPRPRSFDLE